MNIFLKPAFSSARSSFFLSRGISQFEIWSNKPEQSFEKQGTQVTKPTILVFGFAGSTKSRALKPSQVYNKLGYPTLTCVLPLEHLFHYDVENIKKCAREVIEKVENEEVTDVVFHCLSNNGGALYQQVSQEIERLQKPINIRAAVFDSAPGPGTMIQNTLGFCAFALPGVEKLRWQNSKYMLTPAYAMVCYSNGKSVKEIIPLVLEQVRCFRQNWKKNKDVPWVGPYMMFCEKKTWPLLFLFSKKDKLMSWRYVQLVATKQSKLRRVETFLFPDSGHVAHLKVHPQLFTKTVDLFLKQLS